MTSTTTQHRTRGSRAVLDVAVAAMAAKRRAEVAVLEAALGWAHQHLAADDAAAASWSPPSVLWGEQMVPLVGPGTPRVREFAPAELAAALDITHEAALALMGDALDLAHRLPRLWGLVRDLRVPAHLARHAAQESRDLSIQAADHADRLLVWQPRRLSPHRVGVLVHEARLYADPDRAVADHDHALETRGVDVHHEHGAPGTSAVFMTLDVADAVAFDTTVSTLATTMGALGHPGSRDVRRAHAVGILADPQRALDLLAVDPADPDRPDPKTDPAVCVAEDAMYAPATPFRGDATVVLHVTDRDLLHQHLGRVGGVATSETLGPVLLGQVARWLAGAGNVTIRPVLDPQAIRPVDQHDPPARMAEAVRLRDVTCVFPVCNRPAEGCDLDHVDPYIPMDEGGPLRQTSYDNLAPLCRRHHRAKTFGGFKYRRRPDGSYEWTLPSGTRTTTDPPSPRPQPKRPSSPARPARRQPFPPC